MKPQARPHATPPARRLRGLSLIELMVVVAVAVVIIGLAAPSFSDYIVTQRVRSVHAQLVTDLQYARSEAAARGRHVSVQFAHRAGDGEEDGSCYIIFSRPDPAMNPRYCNCFGAEGSRCTSSDTAEIRRVLVPNRLQVSVRPPDAVVAAFSAPAQPGVNFDPRTGGYAIGTGAPTSLETTGFIVTTQALTGDADPRRALRVTVNGTGRTTLCTPSGSILGGEPCP
jgi:prepilin-type N-terminal cleavage/methylation domain-containing protein